MGIELEIEDLLSVPEAAARRGVAVTTIYEAVKRGALPARRVLGRIGLIAPDVDAWEPATYGGVVRAKKTRGIRTSHRTTHIE